MSALLDLLMQRFDATWGQQARQALESLFDGGRYGKRALVKVQIRVNGADKPENVPFAALIPAGQPEQGPYGGMSFVIFPVPQGPALVGLVVGTNGLQPDEDVLSRPGHARKVASICAWLNRGSGRRTAWAKRDPVRTDIDLPHDVRADLAGDDGRYAGVFDRYGKVIYAMYVPATGGHGGVEAAGPAIDALLDLAMEERGQYPLTTFRSDYEKTRSAWLAHSLPVLGEPELAALLGARRFVIVEGPPGTGKTRLARRLLGGVYGGRGVSIQFHPSTTYEDFVGGLSPRPAGQGMGLEFEPRMGHLMSAARSAGEYPDRRYLLHIDEINRADLSKVLGEAIFLLEPAEPDRTVTLLHDFGPPFGATLRLPPNLHILGTMNSADRSIAILDLAIRRRFAFTRLHPQARVVEEHGGARCREAFDRLLSIFMEHASDEAFDLMPGHGYFLFDDEEAPRGLATGVAPLLREYLRQGYVAGFADEIDSYLGWLETL